MGYYISLRGSKFRIAADRKGAALDALRAMWKPARHDQMGGFALVTGHRTEHFYAWMNGTALSNGTCQTFEQGMAEWGYPVDINDAGDVVGIGLDNEKIGDEHQMFSAIAPFVDPDSYIEVDGEDGEIWRWTFDGQRCGHFNATVSFEASS